MAEEFRDQGLAINALWPKTIIGTAAVMNLLGGPEIFKRSRRPEIMSDAAHLILRRRATECTGKFFLDEDVLRENGVTDFNSYAMEANMEIIPDLFIERSNSPPC
jgi:citronellol/citronellal dehydrogenase